MGIPAFFFAFLIKTRQGKSRIYIYFFFCFSFFQSLELGFSHRIKQNQNEDTGKLWQESRIHILPCFFLFFFASVSSFLGFVLEGLSFRKTLTRLVMTTSVTFTGVLPQGKMNFLFKFHRNFFLLNLIDHQYDQYATQGSIVRSIIFLLTDIISGLRFLGSLCFWGVLVF